MGATSATGVGQGSVEGKDHGRKEYTVAANRLIGPRVVAAGTVTLATGSATVILPLLPGVVGDYIVLATDYTNANAVKAVLTFESVDSKITFTGNSTDVIQYAVVKKGVMP
jgi:hypothetical protein